MKDVDQHLLPRTRGLLSAAPVIAAVFFVAGYFLGTSSSLFTRTDTDTVYPRVVAVAPTRPAAKEAIAEPEKPPHDLFQFRTKCADPIPQSQHLETILYRVYGGESPYTDFPSAETSSLLLPPAERLRGWGSTTAVFADLISAVRPRTIIELGTFLGASALHMASVARNLSLTPVILCVDDFRGWPGVRAKLRRELPKPRNGDSLLLHQFMLHVAAANETERIVPVPFSTGSALAALCEWGVYGDLIEVDAGHDFHSAWADINMAYAVLRPGGVLFGHDYFTVLDNRGVRRAVTLFAKVNGLTVRPHGQHWVLSPKPKQ